MDQNQNQFENVYQNSATPTVKNASYFRTRAREALKEKWGDAILIGFLFSLLCGGVVGGFSGVSSNFSVNIDLGGGFSGMLPSALLGIFAVIAGVLALMSIAYSLFVAAPIQVGYMKTNLELVDGKKPQVPTLFSYFKINYLKTVGLYGLYNLILSGVGVAGMMVAGGVSIGLIVPAALLGMNPWLFLPFAIIIALILVISVVVILTVVSYSYRYAFMILAEYPHLKAIEALRMSRNLMKGNKWKLFCLDFSFIGWYLLATCCTCGIGMIAVLPYHQVASAAFYDDISNRSQAKETEFPSLDPDDYTPDDEKSDETADQAPNGAMGEGMPFTSEIMFPSLDLDDYETDDKKQD